MNGKIVRSELRRHDERDERLVGDERQKTRYDKWDKATITPVRKIRFERDVLDCDEEKHTNASTGTPSFLTFFQKKFFLNTDNY